MKTINIKGKEYVPVSERLKEFRKQHPNWGLLTEVLEVTEGWIVIKAIIRGETNRVIAEGIASEFRDDRSSMVNKTSYVENCETSAWGRALANLGIGIDATIASADEVAAAIEQQSFPDQSPHTPETAEATLEQVIDALDLCQSELALEMFVSKDAFKKQVAYLKKHAPDLYEKARAHKNHILNKLQLEA